MKKGISNVNTLRNIFGACFLIYMAIGWYGLIRSHAEAPINESAQIAAYFSPAGGCTEAICKEIGQAKEVIAVQAYGFTSRPIINALVAALKRGVKVTAILDASNLHCQYSGAETLSEAGAKVLIDNKVRIAHSKVMILDESTLITGSFNFTAAAETSNAENLLIIKKSHALIERYLENFSQRLYHADQFQPTCKR